MPFYILPVYFIHKSLCIYCSTLCNRCENAGGSGEIERLEDDLARAQAARISAEAALQHAMATKDGGGYPSQHAQRRAGPKRAACPVCRHDSMLSRVHFVPSDLCRDHQKFIAR